MKKIDLKIRSRAARGLLRVTLALVTLVAVAVLISYLQEAREAPASAAYIHRAMLEYLLAGVAISLGGALLVEAIAKENTKK